MNTATNTIPTITLNDGTSMPQLGYGVFQVPDEQTTTAVSTALETGYRSIDTAAIYGNESGVGRALAASGLPRGELFVTTKLWLADLGRETTRGGLAASLDKLGLDHVDLYLIHWPGTDTEAYLESWQVLEELRAEGLTRSIGVSNFLPEQLERVIGLDGTVPAVNQVELHPFLQNRETAAVNRAHGIATEAWSPLAQGAVLDDPAVLAAAAAHGVGAAQVILRWHLQQGNVVIPKSVTASRMASNLELFGFDLDTAQVAALDALERDGRTGPFPGTFNG
ncbi:aldo/keto reductase [Paeniglutamicibacter psychrophenolicus]|uniref:2,5-diketo-D-gluconate reductase A n=1 Tax=Paeniglutamicibacter psychrophenolicus TaxID=257454 RepID=A0ABS4WAI9_9MICC|nr:aldo/keto reductase [Paeniglutamicibacter psychrophenolicus]MBP2373222.1 2,5-diketo-D-gluconate reductase A [Paeniglutamicibacter psychrophenolicus]